MGNHGCVAADRLPYEPQPQCRQRAERPIPGHLLVNVLHLALGNEMRTPEEQALLLELCEQVAPEALPFWDPVAEAVDSWQASPCRRCERPTNAGDEVCDDCVGPWHAEVMADLAMERVLDR